MKIIFALALNNNGIFEKRHFGDTDKFAIYSFENNELNFREEVKNTFKTMDEALQHGSKNKGNAIVAFLKEKGVSVLVSKQFGKNLKMINQHFIPVIISEDSTEQALHILLKHIGWFKDELKNRNTDYMLFYIKNGILKMNVKKD
jgi:predicted Fe-Mo cluster-binding NifX family protein